MFSFVVKFTELQRVRLHLDDLSYEGGLWHADEDVFSKDSS